jgi:hypothetical protein
MMWCEDDDCECYRPECAEHGCMNERSRVVDTSDELHQILGEALANTSGDGNNG